MSESILLDTNIVITIINKNPSLIFELRKLTNQWIYIAGISIFELFSFPGMSLEEEKKAEEFISNLKVIPLDYNIAKTAAILARTRPNKQKRADLIIAATAINKECSLVTFNTKDFVKIPSLRIVEKEKLGL